MYKGDRFNKQSIRDVRTQFKATETFQYMNFYLCHPPGVTKGFIKGEALRLLRTNSSQFTFEVNMSNFKTRLQIRDYPARIVEKHLLYIKISDKVMSLTQKNKTPPNKILPFLTQYHPALPNLQDTLMGKWHLIENQLQLREIFKKPPIISYHEGKSLKDIYGGLELQKGFYYIFSFLLLYEWFGLFHFVYSSLFYSLYSSFYFYFISFRFQTI